MSSAVIEYSLIVDTAKGTSKIKKVSNALNDIGEEGQKAGRKAGNALEGIGGKLIILNQGIELASKAFRLLATPITKIVEVGAKFETLHLQLNKVLGSAQKGKEYFSWLKEFSTSTPFKMEGLAESVIMLENFGINAKKNLTTLGDTASALSIPLKNLSLIMGKIYKKPKASMEEMLQLIGEGVPVFDILQEKLGLTAEQVGDIGRAGISGKKAFDALLSGMTEKYGGSMKDLSKTWRGLMSTLSDWWDRFLNKIAESGVLDSLKSRLEGIIKKLETWSKDGSLEKFAKGIGDAITGIISGIGSVIKFFIEWKNVIVFAGKAWLTYFAIGKMSSIWGKFKEGLAGLINKTTGFGNAIKKIPTSLKFSIAVIGLELVMQAIDMLDKHYDEVMNKIYADNEKEQKQFKEFRKLQEKYPEIVDQALKEEKKAMKQREHWYEVQKLQAKNRFKIAEIEKAQIIEMGKTHEETLLKVNKNAIKSAKEKIKALKFVKAMFFDIEGTVKKTGETETRLTKEQLKAIKDKKKAYEGLAETMGVLTQSGFKKLRRESNLLHRVWANGKTQILGNEEASEKWIQKIEKIKQEYSKIGKNVPKWLELVEKAINKENNKTIKQVVAIKQSTNALEDMSKKGIIPGIKNTKDLTDKTDAWKLILEDADPIAKKTFKDIANSVAKVTDKMARLAGGAANLAGSLASVGIVSADFAKDISMVANGAEGVAGVAGGIAKIASADVVGGVIAVAEGLGKVIESIDYFFGGDGIQEAIDRENSWMNITEELNDKLHELADELGDTHLATSKMLKELMVGNVTYQNFGEWVKRTQDILADFDRGMLSSNETASLIGENFNYLIQQADKLGISGGKAMIELMDDIKARGIEVKEISEYIAKMNKEGLADYKLMKSALEEGNLQEEINKLHNSLANMKLGSAKYEETYNKLKELELKLGDIKNAQEIFGDVSIAVYDEMIAYEKKVAENSALENAIKGYAGAMIRLSATTKLTEDQYQSFEDTAASAYDKLIAQGYTSEQATKSMVPMLKQLAYLQQQFGYEIDDSTQAMIDQAIEQGSMSGDFRTDSQKMVDALEKLVNLMERGLGNAINKATKGFKSLGNNVIDIGRKWNGLHFKDIRGNIKISNIPTIPKANHFATGGYFTANKPTPILVGDGPVPEDVLIMPQNKGSKINNVQQDNTKKIDVRIEQNNHFTFGDKMSHNDKEFILGTVEEGFRNGSRDLVEKAKEAILRVS